MTKRTGIAVAGLLLTQALLAGADRLARVDAEGVLRWTDTGGEVALLGVNYYTPFTIDHAALKRLVDQGVVQRPETGQYCYCDPLQRAYTILRFRADTPQEQLVKVDAALARVKKAAAS